jgi:hypothetical protein
VCVCVCVSVAYLSNFVALGPAHSSALEGVGVEVGLSDIMGRVGRNSRFEGGCAGKKILYRNDV